MSRRTEIFNAVKAELQKIAGASVSSVHREIEDVEKFPRLELMYSLERKETAATAGPSNKKSELELLVRVYVREETEPRAALDALIDSIESEIEDDASLGKSYPCFARVVEVEEYQTALEAAESGAAQYGIADVLIRVEYRHQRANP